MKEAQEKRSTDKRVSPMKEEEKEEERFNQAMNEASEQARTDECMHDDDDERTKHEGDIFLRPLDSRALLLSLRWMMRMRRNRR